MMIAHIHQLVKILSPMAVMILCGLVPSMLLDIREARMSSSKVG